MNPEITENEGVITDAATIVRVDTIECHPRGIMLWIGDMVVCMTWPNVEVTAVNGHLIIEHPTIEQPIYVYEVADENDPAAVARWLLGATEEEE